MSSVSRPASLSLIASAIRCWVVLSILGLWDWSLAVGLLEGGHGVADSGDVDGDLGGVELERLRLGEAAGERTLVDVIPLLLLRILLASLRGRGDLDLSCSSGDVSGVARRPSSASATDLMPSLSSTTSAGAPSSSESLIVMVPFGPSWTEPASEIRISFFCKADLLVFALDLFFPAPWSASFWS